jgi:hypothetical protein
VLTADMQVEKLIADIRDFRLTDVFGRVVKEIMA